MQYNLFSHVTTQVSPLLDSSLSLASKVLWRREVLNSYSRIHNKSSINIPFVPIIVHTLLVVFNYAILQLRNGREIPT
jgi:hypothetical protein